MPYGPYSIAHVVLGFFVLLLYWTPLLARKGSALHKRVGTWFFMALAPIVASVVPIVLFDLDRRGPAAFVQILYLALCIGTVSFTAWNASRCKNDLVRFRSTAFVILAVGMAASGCSLLAIGLATHSGLPIVFSTIGIGYGTAMLRFYRLGLHVQPRWWLTWHAGSACLLFSATHGSVLAVIWKFAVGPGSGDAVQIVTQSLTLLFSMLLFGWMARSHAIPLQFKAEPVGDITEIRHFRGTATAPVQRPGSQTETACNSRALGL